jgi:hypothetical protein
MKNSKVAIGSSFRAKLSGSHRARYPRIYCATYTPWIDSYSSLFFDLLYMQFLNKVHTTSLFNLELKLSICFQYLYQASAHNGILSVTSCRLPSTCTSALFHFWFLISFGETLSSSTHSLII